MLQNKVRLSQGISSILIRYWHIMAITKIHKILHLQKSDDVTSKELDNIQSREQHNLISNPRYHGKEKNNSWESDLSGKNTATEFLKDKNGALADKFVLWDFKIRLRMKQTHFLVVSDKNFAIRILRSCWKFISSFQHTIFDDNLASNKIYFRKFIRKRDHKLMGVLMRWTIIISVRDNFHHIT